MLVMKLKSIPWQVLLAISILACSKDDDPVVITDEGIFINEIYAASGVDWIEIFNESDEVKDLSGYKIYDDGGVRYSLPSGTSIAGKGYLVLVCDDTGVGLNPDFKLSSAGETVTLENSASEIIDRVAFPAMNDGESYGRYPDGSANFRTSGASTRGASNGEAIAPLIADVARQPLIVLPNSQAVISAAVTANAGSAIESVTLLYRVDGGAFTSLAMSAAAGSVYTATIPSFENARVEYYIEAKAEGDVNTFSPFDAPEGLYEYNVSTATLPDLYINEVMAINGSCCPDTDGTIEEFDDWIEIYNSGSEPVDIAGMFLSDDPLDPFKSQIPEGNSAATTIPAGGFIRLWADEDGSQGELHLNFQLSGAGETLGIYFIDGRTIDERTLGAQTENISSGLTQDGGTTWATLPQPTPAASNE
jgi:hypothetical protein